MDRSVKNLFKRYCIIIIIVLISITDVPYTRVKR